METMNPTRYDEIDIDKDTIPEGLVLIEGKNLPQTCRLRGREIPYGRAFKRGRDKRNCITNKTIGIVVAKKDEARFLDLKNQSRRNQAKQKLV